MSEERLSNFSTTTPFSEGGNPQPFASCWVVSLLFRAAYALPGNGIVERNWLTVKVIAARKHCSIAEAVHMYNLTPCDGMKVTEAPASGVYHYEMQDCVRLEKGHRAVDATPDDDKNEVCMTGIAVWIRMCGEHCTTALQSGVATMVNLLQVMEVDGVPWHVRLVALQLRLVG